MFQSQMNKKKREIWEVKVDRKKLWHNFLDTRSEDGFGFLRPGLKTGVESDNFWSEIGSGFGKTGQHTPTKNSQEYPPGGGGGGAKPYFLLRSQENKRRLFSQDAKELT